MTLSLTLTNPQNGGPILSEMKQIWKSHNITLTAKVRPMKVLVWPVAKYGCENGNKKRDEERIEAFEMTCIRKIIRVSWTQKKTNEWVLRGSRNGTRSAQKEKLVWSNGGNCHTSVI